MWCHFPQFENTILAGDRPPCGRCFPIFVSCPLPPKLLNCPEMGETNCVFNLRLVHSGGKQD